MGRDWRVDLRSMAQGILSKNSYHWSAALFLLYLQVFCMYRSMCEGACVSSLVQISMKCKYSATPSI